jgi:hypothetical protein
VQAGAQPMYMHGEGWSQEEMFGTPSTRVSGRTSRLRTSRPTVAANSTVATVIQKSGSRPTRLRTSRPTVSEN